MSILKNITVSILTVLLLSSCGTNKGFTIKDIPDPNPNNPPLPGSSNSYSLTLSKNTLVIPDELLEITLSGVERLSIEGLWYKVTPVTDYSTLHTIIWDGKGTDGKYLPSGTYLIKGLNKRDVQVSNITNPGLQLIDGNWVYVGGNTVPIQNTITIVNNESEPEISINKEIISSKVSNPINISIKSEGAWSLSLEGSAYTRSGSGNSNFTITSTELGSSLIDGIYSFNLTSGTKSISKTIKIDNTPPKVKSISYSSSGQPLKVYSFDPLVNSVNSGIEEYNSNLDILYGKNKKETVALNVIESGISISSLSVNQMNNVIEKGTYSFSIKDKVGNILNFSNNCLEDYNQKQKDLENKIKPFEESIKTISNEINNLRSLNDKNIKDYNSLRNKRENIDNKISKLTQDVNSLTDLIESLSEDESISDENKIQKLETRKTKILSELDNLDTLISTLESETSLKILEINELDNQIKDKLETLKTLKNEIENLLTSLDGECISYTQSPVTGPITGTDSKGSIKGAGLIAGVQLIIDLAYKYVDANSQVTINENNIYMQQQKKISNNLRNKVKSSTNITKSQANKARTDLRNNLENAGEGCKTKAEAGNDYEEAHHIIAFGQKDMIIAKDIFVLECGFDINAAYNGICLKRPDHNLTKKKEGYYKPVNDRIEQIFKDTNGSKQTKCNAVKDAVAKLKNQMKNGDFSFNF
jgi:hypothetical protein